MDFCTFGNDWRASFKPPAKQDLCWSFAFLGGDGFYSFFQHAWIGLCRHGELYVRAWSQRGECGDDDAFFFAESHQKFLIVVRMNLNLKDGGGDTGVGKYVAEGLCVLNYFFARDAAPQ